MDLALTCYYKIKAIESSGNLEPENRQSLEYKAYHFDALKEFEDIIRSGVLENDIVCEAQKFFKKLNKKYKPNVPLSETFHAF